MRILLRCALVALVVTGLFGQIALADATPIELVLLYMPGVSTTGTKAASGIAELVMPEGEVRITAADLPHLDDTQQYVAWVLNSNTNAFQRVGAFNTSEADDSVRYENVLPDALPDKQWNLLLVTVEADANATHPSDQHSIAGVFPSGDNDPLPGLLPNTGGLVDDSSPTSHHGSIWSMAERLPVPGLLALTLTLGLAAGYVGGRRHPRRAR